MRSSRLALAGLLATMAACSPRPGERWDFGMTHLDYVWDKFTVTSTLR